MVKFLDFKVGNRTHSVRADKIIAVLDSHEGGCHVCMERFDDDSTLTIAESRESVIARVLAATNEYVCEMG